MDIKLSKAGEWKYVDKALRWSFKGDDYLDTSIAGEMMRASKDEDGVISLAFMGYLATGFDTMDDALKAGPEFALKVFDLLKQRVIDFPPQTYRPPQFLSQSDGVEP